MPGCDIFEKLFLIADIATAILKQRKWSLKPKAFFQAQLKEMF